jgi:hypothetical protein
VKSHDVHCDGRTAIHLLVRLELVDGEPVAELHAAGGTRRVSRAAAGDSLDVVVACACGSFTFDVGRYLAGEWIDPVRVGS